MPDWSSLEAPSLAEIWRRWPRRPTRACRRHSGRSARASSSGSRISPTTRRSREMECESEFDLLGLFRGIGLAQGAARAADRAVPEHDLALPPPDPRLLGRARGDPRPPRHPRARARDRPSFRAVGRGHGGDRGGGRGRVGVGWGAGAVPCGQCAPRRSAATLFAKQRPSRYDRRPARPCHGQVHRAGPASRRRCGSSTSTPT